MIFILILGWRNNFQECGNQIVLWAVPYFFYKKNILLIFFIYANIVS